RTFPRTSSSTPEASCSPRSGAGTSAPSAATWTRPSGTSICSSASDLVLVPATAARSTRFDRAALVRRPCLRRVGVVLPRRMPARQAMLRAEGRRSSRQRVDRLPEARDLERGKPLPRPCAKFGEIEGTAGLGDDERLYLVLSQLGWHSDDRDLKHVRVRLD